MQSNLSRHRDGSSFVLLRLRELSGARRRDKGRKGLIWVFATHVQENVAFAPVLNAINSACYGCGFPDMFCRFYSRVIGSLGTSSAEHCEYGEQCFSFHDLVRMDKPSSNVENESRVLSYHFCRCRVERKRGMIYQREVLGNHC
jgi:hypothetical protein